MRVIQIFPGSAEDILKKKEKTFSEQPGCNFFILPQVDCLFFQDEVR